MMILAYPLLFIAELLISALAVLLSPILALLYVTRDSHPYCSAPNWPTPDHYEFPATARAVRSPCATASPGRG